MQFFLDDDDYERLKDFKWVLRFSPGGTISAHRSLKGKYINLVHDVLQDDKTFHIIYKDNNRFNCTKNNLLFGTASKKQSPESLISIVNNEAVISDGKKAIAIVDIDDLEKVKNIRWNYVEGRGVIGKVNKKQIRLTSIILNIEPGEYYLTKFIDGDRSNYRKSNIKKSKMNEIRTFEKSVNEYTTENNITTLHVSIGHIKLEILIDADDTDRVISYCKWTPHEVTETFNYKFYAVGQKNNKQIKLHRFIMGVTNPKIHIDHINGNSLDNRKSNLRIATAQQNAHNTTKTNGRSGDKNVYWNEYVGKWWVLFRDKQKSIYSRKFINLEEAIVDAKEKRSIYQPTSPEGTNVKFNLASFIPKSKVNGPGLRSVAWVGGCLRGCKNCFNPELWSFKPRNLISPEDLAEKIINSGSEGFTLSGGDPLDSPVETLRLLRALHPHGKLHEKLKKGIIMFTGFTIEEIETNFIFKEIVKLTDLTIEGRYIDELRTYNGLHGSSNQRFVWNNSKDRGKSLINEDEIIFDQDIEVHVDESGLHLTGFPDLLKQSKDFLKELGVEVKMK
jgi:anaerobic ribonucleoside-triphosphate reductase activating protein